jgi:hypothetical protein
VGFLPAVGSPPPVWNPSNPGENLARQWREEPGSYERFGRFAVDLQSRMIALANTSGMEAIAAALRELFDPTDTGIVARAIGRFTESFQSKRVNGQVRMDTSRKTLTTAASAPAVSIPRNSFYGRTPQR